MKDRDFDIVWDNRYAVIYARDVAKANHLSIIIKDENGWRKAEKFIEQ
jgi:hypothetical protein